MHKDKTGTDFNKMKQFIGIQYRGGWGWSRHNLFWGWTSYMLSSNWSEDLTFVVNAKVNKIY